MNYLRMATGTKLIAVAKSLKTGKNIAYYNVDVFNDKNELVANANVNMFFTDVKVGD